jgi:hypothetical protein
MEIHSPTRARVAALTGIAMRREVIARDAECIPLACIPVNRVYTRPRINPDMEIQHGCEEEGEEEGFEEEVIFLPHESVVG